MIGTLSGGLLGTGVAPVVPSSYESIATANVGSGGTSSIVFDLSAVSGYKHLQLRYIVRNSLSLGYFDGIFFYFNTDNSDSNYYRHSIQAEGAGSPGAYAYNALPIITYPANNQLTNTFCGGVIDIYEYQNTNKTKTVRLLEGIDINGAGADLLRSFMWNSTTAINKITFERSGYGFAQFSQIALYGIKD